MTCLLLSVHQVSMKLPFCFVFALYHLVSCDGTIILRLIKVFFFFVPEKSTRVRVYIYVNLLLFFFYCLLLLRHMLIRDRTVVLVSFGMIKILFSFSFLLFRPRKKWHTTVCRFFSISRHVFCFVLFYCCFFVPGKKKHTIVNYWMLSFCLLLLWTHAKWWLDGHFGDFWVD